MSLVTGRECSLTVGTKKYDTVVNGFELAFDTESLTYDTLSGPRAAGGKETGTLSITFAYDSTETDSLFDALWAGAGTALDYVAKAGGSDFTGKAIAVRPSVPAKAGEVSEVTVELPLDGIPAKAAAAVQTVAPVAST
jgi:hypothetical protein